MALRALFANQPRIDVSRNFVGLEGAESSLRITNVGGDAIVISYWEVCWEKRTWRGAKLREAVSEPDYDEKGYPGFVLQVHQSRTLPLDVQKPFVWGVKAETKGNLYAYLHIAGRSRPLRLRGYRQGE